MSTREIIVREAAILICAVYASTPGLVNSGYTVAQLLGLEGRLAIDAANLAAAAWLEVDGEALGLDGANDPRRDAEAEALLQEGWEP